MTGVQTCALPICFPVTILDQITKAFKAVYKSLTGKELTPELRKMFDDILGKEAEPTPQTGKGEGEGDWSKDVEDDFKKLIFPDLDHSVNLGRMYYFDNNYWITINVDKLKTLSQTVLIRRCNNTLRWIDEQTGAYYQVPCAIGYLIKENRDYSTAGSAMVVPSGMIDCFYQINSKTKKKKPLNLNLHINKNYES